MDYIYGELKAKVKRVLEEIEGRTTNTSSTFTEKIGDGIVSIGVNVLKVPYALKIKNKEGRIIASYNGSREEIITFVGDIESLSNQEIDLLLEVA